MNCRQTQQLLDNLLVAAPGDAERAELAGHVEGCPLCRREHASANVALSSIQLSYKFEASPQLKDRIMSAIAEIPVAEPKRTETTGAGMKLLRRALAVGVAGALLVAAILLLRPGPGGRGPAALSAIALLQQAAAAEAALFSGDQVVHIVNAIEVKPVDDPRWAQSRWFPVASLEATGKPRFHQLMLSAEVGKGYTVKDEAWYDPATARFIRLMTAEKTAIYANSFDGKAVYFLEVSGEEGPRVVRQTITKDFKAPQSPVELLGIGPGLPTGLSEKDKTEALDVSKAGEVTLDDGSQAYVLKVSYSQEGGPPTPEAYHLTTIRKEDHTVAQIEFVAEGESLFVVRRVKTERVESPAVPWDLAGIEKRVAEAGEKPKAGIMGDLVIPNVSVEHMIERASSETYLFSPNPPGTTKREIIDIRDMPAPPHRAFAVAYRAKDGRHVVLWQAESNKLVAAKLTAMGKVVYTAPSGAKVWSVPMSKWLAGILLQSAKASIKDPPAASRTGYVLETPAGTFPTLAINGRLTDAELHALVDSLVPAKECLEEGDP